jgi:hypothetical protein
MPKSTVIRTALAASLACTLGGIPSLAQAASNSEQIIFSGIGVPPTSSEPFGFWVWCQAEQASSHSHYETDCNGAMYFYARGITTHVTGEVSEPEEGVYVMDLDAPRAGLQCSLSNLQPIVSGPHNTVIGECTLNGQDISGLMSQDAVVIATGPG